MSVILKSLPSRRTVAVTAAFAGAFGALAASTRAFAGECPPDKVGVDVMKPGTSKGVGVVDKVIGEINLVEEKVNLSGYQIRARHLVVEAGGEVPWHSHAERPALIYIVSGEITEYRSTCVVPLVRKAGELAVENHEVSHWWKNHGKIPCVVLSFDLFHSGQDPHMM
jgi:quercetin dioxygenase-like cupin family protein